jgi:hypothetical protein
MRRRLIVLEFDAIQTTVAEWGCWNYSSVTLVVSA